MASKKKDDFYVSLSDTHTINLNLLECQKTSLESMKLLQQIKQVRQTKNEQKHKLHKQLRLIHASLNKFKRIIHCSLLLNFTVWQILKKDRRDTKIESKPKL